MNRETVIKISNGDALTDKELLSAIDHYESLCKKLAIHGELYHLVWRDAYLTLDRLKGYKSSRGI